MLRSRRRRPGRAVRPLRGRRRAVVGVLAHTVRVWSAAARGHPGRPAVRGRRYGRMTDQTAADLSVRSTTAGHGATGRDRWAFCKTVGSAYDGSNPPATTCAPALKPHVRAPVRPAGRGSLGSGHVRPAPAGYACSCPMCARTDPVGAENVVRAMRPADTCSR